jgi:trans-aconitate methyltransferase
MMNFQVQQIEGFNGFPLRYYTTGDTEDLNPVANQMAKYAHMSKDFMNKPMNGGPDAVVGNYFWHEMFPYVPNLLKGIEDKLPVRPRVADFGGGPGRVIKRFQAFSSEISVIDVSRYALDYFLESFNGDEKTTAYESSGMDVGDAPEDHFDLVYSTISFQHIPSRTIRRNILRGVHNILHHNGWISFQMGYNPTYEAGVWSHDTTHAKYDSDYWDAERTNGHADCTINEKDLPLLMADFGDIFKDVSYHTVDVAGKYQNLNGQYHAPYWASDWIFIKGRKG